MTNSEKFNELRDGVTPEIKAVNPMACSYDVFYEACTGRLAKSPEGQRKRIDRELDRLQKYGAFFDLEYVYNLLKILSSFDERSFHMSRELIKLSRATLEQLERINRYTNWRMDLDGKKKS